MVNFRNDHQERLEALNVRESFIVQAPAGSGKTSLLISRFIGLLNSVQQPEEILAVTFTRKATAEMRERILNVLDPNLYQQLPQDSMNRVVEQVRERSQRLGWDLLNQPSRLQIMTIDALATSLIRRMPWASRFGSVPGVVENLTDVYETAAANAIDFTDTDDSDVRQALKKLYAQVDNNASKLQTLIVEMLSKRDQWLRILVHSEFGDDEKRKMEAVWQSIVEDQLNQLRDLFPPDAAEILAIEKITNNDPDAVKSWALIAEALLTETGTWRKRISVKQQYGNLTKTQIEKVVADCETVSGLDKALNQARKLPVPQYGEEQWKVLQAITTVLQYAVAHLRLEFRRRGQVDFIEIAQQAEAALGTSDDPTDLSLVLDYRYQHILVDEFQDTSISQRNLVKSLIGGWQPDDGRTLFMVGDPMQSIYRFREAEVGIYLSVQEKGIGNLHPKPLGLMQNFRSNQDLVHWFNTVFQHSFPAKSDVMGGQVSYARSSSEIVPQHSESVHIRLQSNKNPYNKTIPKNTLRRIEADQVVADIKNFLDRNQDARAAILVRSRNHVDFILPLLDEEGVRYYTSEFIRLSDRPVVHDLLSLTRALLNLTDRISWFAILRAPWCGLSLDDMLVIAEARSGSIWNAMNNDVTVSNLSAGGQKRVLRIREVLHRAFSIRGRFEVRQWVEDTWTLLGGPGCVASHDVENARLLLDLVEHHSTGTGVENLGAFEKYLIDLYAVPVCSPDDANVHIITIHGAKGLEFDAVFIPCCDKASRPSPQPLLIWSEFLSENSGSQLLISPIAYVGSGTEDPMFEYLKKWTREKDRYELTRLAYVACTREKSELYIYGSVNPDSLDLKSDKLPSGDQTLLSALWPGIVASEFEFVTVSEFDELKYHSEEKQVASETDETSLCRLPSDWILPDPPPSLLIAGRDMESPGDTEAIDFDWAGNLAVWVGIVVHEWLDRIVKTGVEQWNVDALKNERAKWRTKLISMGITRNNGNLDFALDRIEIALINVLNDPKGQWLLGGDHEQSESELRLTGFVNGGFRNVILDRTFVDENNNRWIVDYKTGSTKGDLEEFLDAEVSRYKEQLHTYMQLVAGFDSRTIRLGLYFPMFPQWREL